MHDLVQVPYVILTPAAQIGDDQPRSAQNQELQGVSNFVDGSGPILSMYSEMVAEEDKKMAEEWKADADGILIFVGHHLPIPCTTSRTDLT